MHFLNLCLVSALIGVLNCLLVYINNYEKITKKSIQLFLMMLFIYDKVM